MDLHLRIWVLHVFLSAGTRFESPKALYKFFFIIRVFYVHTSVPPVAQSDFRSIKVQRRLITKLSKRDPGEDQNVMLAT